MEKNHPFLRYVIIMTELICDANLMQKWNHKENSLYWSKKKKVLQNFELGSQLSQRLRLRFLVTFYCNRINENNNT